MNVETTSKQPETSMCERDARTILEMEMVCRSEGIGPDTKELLATIAKQHPEMVAKFPGLKWPNAEVSRPAPKI